VRGILLQRGLREDAVSSVWDWQLGLRESRVTLWLFQLLKGEDCDGTPLPRPDGVPVASLQLPLMPPLAGPMTASVLPGRADEQRDASPTRHKTAGLQTPVRTGEVAKGASSPAPAAKSSRHEVAATGVKAPGKALEDLTLVAPEASTVPARLVVAPPTAPSGPQVPRVPALPSKVAAAPPAGVTLPTTTVGKDDALAITFDADSSYLPVGAARELRRLAVGLDGGKSYAVELEGAVAPEEPGTTTGTGGRSYARWVVERRLARVQELLERDAAARDLTIHQSFVANDVSRRVTLRLRPLS
jgi:hypothetical protein